MTRSRALVLQHRVSMCVSCCAIIGIGNGFGSQGSQIVWVYCTMRVILVKVIVLNVIYMAASNIFFWFCFEWKMVR